MNRHIYGLTLFLVIVKIHFLLYWAFFAPVNFLSTLEAPKIYPVQREYVTRSKCNRSKEQRAVLQNAAIDFDNMKVSANVRFNDLETAFESNEFEIYLHVINEETNVTVSLKPVYGAEAGKVVTFKGALPKNGKWDRKSNYYAQIDFEYGGFPKASKQIFSLEQAVPVLKITDKHR
jgi:hypothetical protein